MKKHCLGYYTIADYEREQKWLNDMSRGGWNLVSTGGIFYTFEKGIPGEYIYKLDLPDERMTDGEIEEYYRFLEECGVEVVCTFKSWRYLRKKRADGDFELKDNTYTQLRMVNKAYGLSSRIINTILVMIAFLIVLSAVVAMLSSGRLAQFMEGLVLGLSSSVVFALAIIFVPISRKLRKRMNELIEELVVKG